MSTFNFVLMITASYVIAIALGHSSVAFVTRGPLASTFIRIKRHIQVRRRVNKAFGKNSVMQPGTSVAPVKLDELRARNSKRRHLALQYLDKYIQQIKSGRELAGALLEALPKEKKLDLQLEMAQVLTRALELVASSQTGKLQPAVAVRPNVEHLWRRRSTATAVLLCTFSWLIVMWANLDSLIIVAPLLISGAAIIVGVLATFALCRDLPTCTMIGVLLMVPAIVLLGLSAASDWAHKGTTTKEGALDFLGRPQTRYEIHYPVWLTGDDVENCRRPIFLCSRIPSVLYPQPCGPIHHYSILKTGTASMNNRCCPLIPGAKLVSHSSWHPETWRVYRLELRRSHHR